jgi:hypothetical protein
LMSTKQPTTGFIISWAATLLLFSINLSNAYSLPLLYKLHEPFPFHCSLYWQLKLPQFKFSDPPVVYISIPLPSLISSPVFFLFQISIRLMTQISHEKYWLSWPYMLRCLPLRLQSDMCTCSAGS